MCLTFKQVRLIDWYNFCLAAKIIKFGKKKLNRIIYKFINYLFNRYWVNYDRTKTTEDKFSI